MKRHIVMLALAGSVATSFAQTTAPASAPKPKVTKPSLKKEEPAAPQADTSGDIFSVLAASINARSVENCDPEVDVPALSANRAALISIPNERSKLESRIEVVAGAAMANDGNYMVCYDTRLRTSGQQAVLYNGAARIIALNPDATNPEQLLRQSYETIRSGWNAVNAGKLERAQFELPQVIGPAGISEPPAKAPHKKPEFR